MIVMLENTSRALAVPPDHQLAAPPLFSLASNFQKRGYAAAQYRLRRATVCLDEHSVGQQVPALQILVES